MKFLRGFKYAFRGIIYCVNNERNMRIHTVVALYALVLSPFFELSRTKYAVLLLTISGVFAAEMVNTAVEELCDLSSAEYNPMARVTKDVAAGAVLIGAIFSVVVGICLFWQPAAFLRMFDYFAGKPWMLCLLLLSLALALIYVVLGPIGIRDRLRGKKANAPKK